jgi:ribosomal protein S18 acetylase RimI-like enzyme
MLHERPRAIGDLGSGIWDLGWDQGTAGWPRVSVLLMHDCSLRPIEERDFGAVAELARAIWLAHYVTIITTAQIEYMLQGRFTAENLRRYLHSSERWMDVLECDAALAGYTSYALTSDPAEVKLEQLYLLPQLHGRGYGRQMLEHVEQAARREGARRLVLQVNKRNDQALAFYRRASFTVREEAVFDVGQGYVMDDYVMVKELNSVSGCNR